MIPDGEVGQLAGITHRELTLAARAFSIALLCGINPRAARHNSTRLPFSPVYDRQAIKVRPLWAVSDLEPFTLRSRTSHTNPKRERGFRRRSPRTVHKSSL
jgi:hypothetical protein